MPYTLSIPFDEINMKPHLYESIYNKDKELDAKDKKLIDEDISIEDMEEYQEYVKE